MHNNQPVLQHRLSQAIQTKNTLARASAIKNISDSMYIIILIFFYSIHFITHYNNLFNFYLKKMLSVIKMLEHL